MPRNVGMAAPIVPPSVITVVSDASARSAPAEMAHGLTNAIVRMHACRVDTSSEGVDVGRSARLLCVADGPLQERALQSGIVGGGVRVENQMLLIVGTARRTPRGALTVSQVVQTAPAEDSMALLGIGAIAFRATDSRMTFRR